MVVEDRVVAGTNWKLNCTIEQAAREKIWTGPPP